MLGQQHEAEQRLAHRQGQEPVPEKKAVASGEGGEGQQGVDERLKTEGAPQGGNGVGRDVGTTAEVAAQSGPVATEFAGPPGQTAELKQIGAQAAGGAILQLRIEPGQMGVAVVPLVVAAIEIGVVEAENAGPPGDRVVETAAGEGGAMAALMHGAEGEGQGPAEQQQPGQGQGQVPGRRQAPGPGGCGLQRQRPQRSPDHDQAEMQAELPQRRCIAAAVQRSQEARFEKVGGRRAGAGPGCAGGIGCDFHPSGRCWADSGVVEPGVAFAPNRTARRGSGWSARLRQAFADERRLHSYGDPVQRQDADGGHAHGACHKPGEAQIWRQCS